MKNILIITTAFLLFFSGLAKAADKTIFICNGSSERFETLYIELTQNEAGKLASKYTFGKFPLHDSGWTAAGKITTPPARLPQVLKEINAFRDTGIDPDKVKLFQMIFIDGSGKWDIELWKLMDENEKTLGWTAYAYGSPLGCY